jgi:ribosomal protein S18 acetylase RimI-like enzyme
MNTVEDQLNFVTTPESIDGLTFHPFRGDEDLNNILDVREQLRLRGLHDGALDLDSLKNEYEHLSNCDLSQDFLMAEIKGQPVGYIRRWWEVSIADANTIHLNSFWMLPEWLETELGDYMVDWVEARTLQVDKTLADHNLGDRIEFWAAEIFQNKIKLLLRHGYKPLRHFFGMSRSIEGDLPDQPLPEGLEARPVLKSQLRQVWEASNEAFADEWGATQSTEEEYLRFINDKNTRPELWQVAWDGDQVAGAVLNFMDLLENEQKQRYRGYTEGISVRRPYRGRGVASALICRSMRMFKAMNMTEVALGVDSESPTGALGLYSRLGYQTYRRQAAYAKPLVELISSNGGK